MRLFSAMTASAVAAATSLFATIALADDQLPELPVRGAPVAGGTALQDPASSVASGVVFLDNLLLWIIVPITIFVTALLIWVIVFHNRRANPEPAKFTHNSPLEVAWTAIPALILLVIAFFSFPALRYEQTMPEADVTIKTTGFQWYWGYEYVDHDVEFSSFMLQREELEDYGYTQDLYLLATDTAMVVPVGKDIVVQVTAADVIHSWAIPAFGVKQDGVPGRLAELWFNVEEEGVYFGQCSELCGINHAYMPITVKAVSEEEYVAWLERQGAQFAEGSWEADVRDRVQLATAD
ncbi:MAG: aa3-type cytochrome c oxidase subunit II CoxB [Roseibaca calidilacus]|uniref:Cytochrome c oxidase subunit 2 n=1 Tax=Roseibaca calidilacus TaxID=1666912 RepID=A0A0P8ADW5_9RHOB|nr:cytochrome c oxidase subunit II [Roseibaca calidilacus]KPP92419.1 MAG: aa3-type cytochrome c oxidase subunit II CoxB [Roseibaca calidilacus]CUX79715.1 cytochrome c oxidase subunit 2 [Roseibaca calidilacus]